MNSFAVTVTSDKCLIYDAFFRVILTRRMYQLAKQLLYYTVPRRHAVKVACVGGLLVPRPAPLTSHVDSLDTLRWTYGYLPSQRMLSPPWPVAVLFLILLTPGD